MLKIFFLVGPSNFPFLLIAHTKFMGRRTSVGPFSLLKSGLGGSRKRKRGEKERMCSKRHHISKTPNRLRPPSLPPRSAHPKVPSWVNRSKEGRRRKGGMEALTFKTQPPPVPLPPSLPSSALRPPDDRRRRKRKKGRISFSPPSLSCTWVDRAIT